jgi:LEA14-like dessication related protein
MRFVTSSLRYTLILAIFFLSGVAGCATLSSLEQPEIREVRPRIAGIDFQGVDLVFDVDVHNPYPVPLKASGFRYRLDIEDARFLDSETESALDIPAAGEGTVALPVRLSYKEIWRTYEGLLSDISEADYRFQGALILRAFGRPMELPVSHAGTFPIFRIPEFHDIRIESPAISLTDMKIGIDAAVMNPNVFPIDVRELGYTLKLGTLTVGNLTAASGGVLEPGETDRLSLSGEVSAASAAVELLKGGDMGRAKLLPSGFVRTPYGAVRIPD